MKSILEMIYSGSLHPDEWTVPKTPEYRQVNHQISGAIEACRRKFSEADFRQMEEVLDHLGDSHSIQSMASFVHGFHMGAGIMMEIFAGQDKLVRERE